MVEFIKGKWYKGPEKNYYIKFSKKVNKGNYNQIHHTESIYNGKYRKVEDFWANTSFEKFALNNPATLEELKKFLPKVHPDLQSNNVIELW